MSTTFEKTVKIVDPKGKVLAELSKVLKDVTVEEFKKLLVRASPFRKYIVDLKADLMSSKASSYSMSCEAVKK